MPKGLVTTLHHLRKRADLTQTELAARINKQQPEISMYENAVNWIPEETCDLLFKVLQDELGKEKMPAIEPVDLNRSWDEVYYRLQTEKL